MPVDVDRLISVMQAALLRDLPDHVDLVFAFGSRVTGRTHRYSDVDLCWVPTDEGIWHNITVMVDETLCDLFPLHWSTLERMAGFDDARGTILLHGRIVYAASTDARDRFDSLAARLRRWRDPGLRSEAIAKAQDILSRAGYPAVLLARAADEDDLLGALSQARRIMDAALHAIVVCNQEPMDTRKLDDVLLLPRLPDSFATIVATVRGARTAGELAAACSRLLDATRTLLLAERVQLPVRPVGYPEAFRAGYPELKADLQHVMLACERGEAVPLDLVSILHETMVHIAIAETGREYGPFDTVDEYESDLVALGFPDLLSVAVEGDQRALHAACQAFDRRLREFLGERGVDLETYPSIDALEAHLTARPD